MTRSFNKISAALGLAFALAAVVPALAGPGPVPVPAAQNEQQQQTPPQPLEGKDLWSWSMGRSYGLGNGCIIQEINLVNSSHNGAESVRYYDFAAGRVISAFKKDRYSTDTIVEDSFARYAADHLSRVFEIGLKIAQDAKKTGRPAPDAVRQMLEDCKPPSVSGMSPTLLPRGGG